MNFLSMNFQIYRGKLVEAEDNMNCQMSSVTVTFRDGRVAQLENIYIRGSKIRSDYIKQFHINYCLSIQGRVDVPTIGQYQFWDTVVCSLLKHMREKVAHLFYK